MWRKVGNANREYEAFQRAVISITCLIKPYLEIIWLNGYNAWYENQRYEVNWFYISNRNSHYMFENVISFDVLLWIKWRNNLIMNHDRSNYGSLANKCTMNLWSGRLIIIIWWHAIIMNDLDRCFHKLWKDSSYELC